MARKIDRIAPKVSKPVSKRGRPRKTMPELDALAEAFPAFPIGETRKVPGTEACKVHADLALARHHLKRIMMAHGISKAEYTTFALADGGLGIEKVR